MLKDTKSLGNNKAPACESRGFVLKKEGVLFDTPSFILSVMNVYLLDFLKINTLYLSATCANVLQISCKPENKHP